MNFPEKLKIVEIGDRFDQEHIQRISYFSDDYLLDADIIFIDFAQIVKEIETMVLPLEDGEPPIDELDYWKIKSKIEQRKKQLLEYFNTGGNLFVQLLPVMILQFNLQNLNNSIETEEIDLFTLITLDSKDYTIEAKRGTNMIFPDPFIYDFYQEFECSYEFTYNRFKGISVGTVKNTKQCVSVLISKSRGNILLMPKLSISADSWEDFNLKSYYIANSVKKLDTEFKNKYKVVSEFSVPEWCSGYYLSNEREQVKKLNLLYEQRDAILNKITQQQSFLSTYSNLKILLFASGTLLEDKVEYIFREFGFEILDTEEKRDDLIIKFAEHVAVIEIKGLKASAAESNAAQLMKWVTTYHVDHKIMPKGILIVNAFKDKSLSERTEQIFPNQMLSYCKKMELNLMTSTQLLGLYLDFKLGDISLEKIQQLLWNTIGILDYNTKKIKRV